MTKRLVTGLFLTLAMTATAVGVTLRDEWRQKRAEAQVRRLADGWEAGGAFAAEADPWGRPVRSVEFKWPGRTTRVVWSDGPDGDPLTEDDVLASAVSAP